MCPVFVYFESLQVLTIWYDRRLNLCLYFILSILSPSLSFFQSPSTALFTPILHPPPSYNSLPPHSPSFALFSSLLTILSHQLTIVQSPPYIFSTCIHPRLHNFLSSHHPHSLPPLSRHPFSPQNIISAFPHHPFS